MVKLELIWAAFKIYLKSGARGNMKIVKGKLFEKHGLGNHVYI